jgi:hypothetical protein
MFEQVYTGFNAKDGPSAGIWAQIPEEARFNPNVGYGFFDDFVDVGLTATQTTQINWGKYKVFNTGSGIVGLTTTVNSVAVAGGILQVGVDTDNDSGSIAVNQPSFRLRGTAAGKKLCFEARIAYSPITTNGLGWILGLGEASLWTFASAVPLNAGDAFTNSGAFVGFQKPEDDTITFDTGYSDRAAQTWVAGSTQIGDAEGAYATAFAFTKIGMVYDPIDKNANGDNLGFYQDGVLLDSGMTNAEIAALTNLDAGLLSPMLTAIADSAGTAGLLYMDWWGCYQMR